MTIREWFSSLLKSKELANIEASLEKSKKDFEETIKNDLKQVEKDSQDLKIASEQLSETAIGLTALLEEKLATVERRFSFLENSIEDIVIIKTSEKKIININSYACKIFGIDEKVCLGKTIEDLMTIYPNLINVLKVFNANESESLLKNAQVKFKTHLKDLLLEVSVTPLTNEETKERELVIIGHAKTEEEALQTELIVNSFPKPLIVLDTDYKVYYLNHSAEKEFGLSNHGAKGKDLTDIISVELAKKFINAIKRNKEKETKVDKTARVFSTHLDGKPKFHIITYI